MGWCRQPKGRKTWQAGYRTPPPECRKVTRTFAKKRDGEIWYKAAEAAIAAGGWIDPADGKVTFRDYAQDWSDRRIAHRGATTLDLETNLRRHVYPSIGHLQLDRITSRHIEAMVKTVMASHPSVAKDGAPCVAGGLAPRTIEKLLDWTGTIFNAAVEDRARLDNPCAKVRGPEVVEEDAMPLSETQLRILIEEIGPRYRAIIEVGLGTGARIAEVCGLTVDRVDFERSTIRIDRQLLRTPTSQPPAFGPVKSRKVRSRIIPVSANTIEAIRRHLALYGPGPDGLIFSLASGRQIAYSTWNDIMAGPADKAGMKGGDRFHQLRHTYVSWLIRGGASLLVVQKRVGHSSLTETARIYGHMCEDDDTKTVVTMDVCTAFILAIPVSGSQCEDGLAV